MKLRVVATFYDKYSEKDAMESFKAEVTGV